MRVLLSGAGSGIGAVLARLLLDRGDEVWLIARNADRAADLEANLVGSHVVVADLADAATAATLALPDSLDGVVHAAGVVTLGNIEDVDVAAWRTQLEVNLVAPAALTARALPALRAARGTVVFLNSGAGRIANPNWGGYAASKFGLRALADSLRAEEQPNGVRVTTIYPGRTATPMQESVHRQEGAPYDAARWIQPETVAAAVLSALDLPVDATMPEIMIRPAEH